jgi:hypothetical protein
MRDILLSRDNLLIIALLSPTKGKDPFRSDVKSDYYST